MVLADTSVWVDHLREGVQGLVNALEEELVLTHPFVLGELAGGNIGNRQEILSFLRDLPAAQSVTDTEALTFIERRALMGRGVGYIDVHLLASAILSETNLWTNDRRLGRVAAEMGVAFV